jgi:hypothetical protein
MGGTSSRIMRLAITCNDGERIELLEEDGFMKIDK